MLSNTITIEGKRRAAAALSTLLMLAGLLVFSQGAWIWTKARVAQVLLRVSWQCTLAGVKDARPWPWADTTPVARLRVPRLGVDEIILAGASGRTMAFAPGHMDGTALPGQSSNCVLTAHRDTHFAFLRHLRAGDTIELQDASGRRWTYRVTTTAIVDQSDKRLTQPGSAASLTLVTCYPFFAVVPGGPQRFVVRATSG
jgi:sortase A